MLHYAGTMHTRTLGDPAMKAARLSRLQEPHIAPLTAFAERLHRHDRWAPYFDPDSGGVQTQVLLLLESPGPKVTQTRFVSADNPDQTAENISCLLKLAGLARTKVLLWNSVPWQLDDDHVVTPTEQHLLDAAPATLELLSLLPELKVVVLVGSKAEKGWAHVAPQFSRSVQVLSCPHPSPVSFGPRPEAAAQALSIFGRARQLCS